MEYRYINILCEGQSEESFIKKILAPYLEMKGIYMKPIVLGGVSRYSGIRKELKRLGRDSSAFLTTMLDFYKLPQDVPGVRQYKHEKKAEPEMIASDIEKRIRENLKDHLACKDFLPYIQMHEFEALLFSDINGFRQIGMSPPVIDKLEKEVKKFPTPEHVNNSEQTAPSKRILKLYQDYQKVSDGTIVAEVVGIRTMIEKCPHFAGWVKKLEELG
jgi:hypothetical protein